ncbi:hypothetical protein [Roseobacter sp.]|uniref:hypothetical protein n=1 Tax=Roseobacter sp. TaxID=1907202 RepID=UPI0032973D56
MNFAKTRCLRGNDGAASVLSASSPFSMRRGFPSKARRCLHAFGGDGGADGYEAELTLVYSDGTTTSLPSKVIYFNAKAGEKRVSVGSSGGGYSDPWQRPAKAVADDIADGLLSE